MTEPDPQLVAAVRSVTAGARLVYLFGSVVTGRVRPDSDLDVAVLYDRPLSVEQRLTLVSRLEEAVGRAVDLLDLSTADPVIRRQVIASGSLIHCTDTAARAAFEMKTLSEYLDLKIDRREIEMQIVGQASSLPRTRHTDEPHST